MKKQYIQPRIKAATIKTGRTMICQSTLGINRNSRANAGQEAWSKEYNDDFDW